MNHREHRNRYVQWWRHGDVIVPVLLPLSNRLFCLLADPHADFDHDYPNQIILDHFCVGGVVSKKISFRFEFLLSFWLVQTKLIKTPIKIDAFWLVNQSDHIKIVNGEYSVNIPSALLLRSSPWLSHLLNRNSCPAFILPENWFKPVYISENRI